jgi:hypothetical protein
VLKGSKLCSWDAPKQHLYSVDLSFPGLKLARLRDTYYVARCCFSWPLLLLPVVQGAQRTPTIAALDAMAEVFSDDFNLKIGGE